MGTATAGAGTPTAGAARKLVEGSLQPFARTRRVTAVNRRVGMPRGITIPEIAAEHADAIRAGFGGGPVDVLGVSTGGSIAQQDAVERFLAAPG